MPNRKFLFSASVSCWLWCHQCSRSATITGSQQWVMSEFPLILQSSVCNSAPFISIRQKSFCHTNGRVNDIVSCFMLPRYRLNISCMCLTTFVRRQREAFIGENNASRPDDVQLRQLPRRQSRQERKTRRADEWGRHFKLWINWWMPGTAVTLWILCSVELGTAVLQDSPSRAFPRHCVSKGTDGWAKMSP